MPKIRTLKLTKRQRTELEDLRDKGGKPYLRERAAALLKIADGAVASQVAKTGLHKRRDPDTVYSWLNKYIDGGVDGIRIQAGRGRKPSFSP